MSERQPSITSVRARVRSLLTGRDVVVLAIDGIPYDVAAAAWPNGTIFPMQSVFPTTSSSAWLSSVTGARVESHGVPGVIFQMVDGELVNIFEYRGPLGSPPTGNLFGDARAAGYVPRAIVGDCEPFDCSWRDALLRDSQWIRGHRFYTSPRAMSADEICAELTSAISACLSNGPAMVWCYLDADRWIHQHGYDDATLRFLRTIDEIAMELVSRDVTVVAYSDHGLTHTRHDDEIAKAIAELPAEAGCAVGGAGRTRWIYSRPSTEDRLVSSLERALPPTIRICHADKVFAAGSLARTRVGNVVLIAEGEDFMTFDGQSFEHGSATDAELRVPFAQWRA